MPPVIGKFYPGRSSRAQDVDGHGPRSAIPDLRRSVRLAADHDATPNVPQRWSAWSDADKTLSSVSEMCGPFSVGPPT